MSYFKEREKLVADKAGIAAEFRQYRTDIRKKLGRLQASLDDEIRRANEEEKELKRLFLFERSIKVHLRHRPDDSEKGEDLQSQPNGAVGKKRRAQKA